MKKIILLLLCVPLCSCISFPANEGALVALNNKNKEVCSNEEPAVLQKRVSGYLSKCFNKKELYLNGANISPRVYVTEHPIPKGETYLASMYQKNGLAYLLAVSVEQGSGECKSTINSYAYNFMWARHFERLDAIAKGEDPSCPL